jgi:hypothetical protein
MRYAGHQDSYQSPDVEFSLQRCQSGQGLHFTRYPSMYLRYLVSKDAYDMRSPLVSNWQPALLTECYGTANLHFILAMISPFLSTVWNVPPLLATRCHTRNLSAGIGAGKARKP